MTRADLADRVTVSANAPAKTFQKEGDLASTSAQVETPRTDAVAAASPDSCGLNELAEQYNKMLDHARQLERELAEAKRDAERYRWLRVMSVQSAHHTPTVFEHGAGGRIIDGDELDAAIDAAIQKAKP